MSPGCPGSVRIRATAAGALAQIDQAVKVLLRRGVEDVEPEEYIHPRLLVRVRRRRPRHRMSENDTPGGAHAEREPLLLSNRGAWDYGSSSAGYLGSIRNFRNEASVLSDQDRPSKANSFSAASSGQLF